MNNYSDPHSATGPSSADSKKRAPSNAYPRIFLPKKIYDALPAAYVSAGTMFILGSVYIGIDNALSVGYSAVGLSCILAGVTVTSMRRSSYSVQGRANADPA